MNSEVTSACSSDPFCLGMCKWTEWPELGGVKSNTYLLQTSSQTLSPRPSTSCSSSIQPLPPSEFFKFAHNSYLVTLAKGYTPVNTSSSTKWALKVFEFRARNRHQPQDCIPHDLLTRCDPALLNIYINWSQKDKWGLLPSCYYMYTHQLLCGLLRHMQE